MHKMYHCRSRVLEAHHTRRRAEDGVVAAANGQQARCCMAELAILGFTKSSARAQAQEGRHQIGGGRWMVFFFGGCYLSGRF